MSNYNYERFDDYVESGADEQLAPVVRGRDAFQRGLERNGPRAVTEFARAEQIWAERARAAGRST